MVGVGFWRSKSGLREWSGLLIARWMQKFLFDLILVEQVPLLLSIDQIESVAGGLCDVLSLIVALNPIKVVLVRLTVPVPSGQGTQRFILELETMIDL